MSELYGPPRPKHNDRFNQHRTAYYLRGMAKKMQRDLSRVIRLYLGKEVRFYHLTEESPRCPTCTDALTGAVVLSNCPDCLGTGHIPGYQYHSDGWVLPEFGARVKAEGEFGNTETTPGGTDTFLVVGLPQLEMGDILIVRDTREIYRVENMEPQIAAVQGEIILQTVNMVFLTPGATEYALIDW
ncbi:MAG: hypothetical protein LHW56_01580 [Candidatus Cloacimonetes bacterium]|nr:hypothetical protein [Candidatus Cloacimonadota bacterium]MDY0171578.1 hypothetical protein [Candidatus Cloacimonadaceae bacterium]